MTSAVLSKTLYSSTPIYENPHRFSIQLVFVNLGAQTHCVVFKMKNIFFFLAITISLSVYGQSNDLKKDIENKYLTKMLVHNDSMPKARFQNFAINLFLKGTKVDEELFKNLNQSLVGACLLADNDSLGNRVVDFNLYSLHYRDDRITNFHKKIYFGKGKHGISNFYVIPYNENQKRILKDAVDSYLYYDSIPFLNQAYKFTKKHLTGSYTKFFQSDNLSTISIGSTYSYIRKSGNYLIQIEGFPDKELNSDHENLYVTDYFIQNWHTITVFIIDEKNGKTYKTVFKE